MKIERVEESSQAHAPRTVGEWLGLMRRRKDETGRGLDTVLFRGEQARKGRIRFLVPERIKDADDLQKLAQRALDTVWAYSVPTIGISGWQMGDPIGVALAQPKIEFEGVRKGRLRDETVEAMQKLFGLETRVRHLHQLQGALKHTRRESIFDIFSGEPVTDSWIQAELADLEERVWPICIVGVARAINGLPGVVAEREMTGPRVRDVVPFFRPSVAIVQVISDQGKAVKPGRGLALAETGLVVLGIVLTACGSQPTSAPGVEVSPTTWAKATATTAPATAEPTKAATATTAPTETAEPTNTPEPTATEVAAADIAAQNEDKMGGYYREEMTYSYTEENGIKYMADEYGNKMLKYDKGWVETSDEEKFGHLASDKADYGVTEYEVTGGGKIQYFNVYWTGYYQEETIHFEEIDQDIPVIRVVYVTRDAMTKKLVRVDDVFGRDMAQIGIAGAFVVDVGGGKRIFPAGDIRLLEIYKKHGVNLVGVQGKVGVYNYKDYMDRLIRAMKEKYKSCIFDPSTGRSTEASRGSCERRLYFQLIDDGKVDFGEDVVAKLINGSGQSIALFDKQITLSANLEPEEVEAIQKDMDTLTKELLASS